MTLWRLQQNTILYKKSKYYVLLKEEVNERGKEFKSVLTGSPTASMFLLLKCFPVISETSGRINAATVEKRSIGRLAGVNGDILKSQDYFFSFRLRRRDSSELTEGVFLVCFVFSCGAKVPF